ncbi:hypothetical protein [Acinetobacter bouvetii]|uniref:Uncharacterized protein n=1 Tax=Acinetobacter bouvetii TaxID=202951 RepID=A0A811GE43_9GAMM|nr:hypothetical protein [Acinetobacter bouvetii]CAB1215699.1 hypothetical protein SFB21_1794 [Acinetobacter bouvetii]
MKNHALLNLLYASLLILTSSSPTYAKEPVAVANRQSEIIYSLFSGTISEDKNQLLFTHCSLSQDQYVLTFNHPEDEKRIRSLIQQDPDFWLNLRASASLVQDKRYLLVDGIAEVYPQKSCHLSKLLSDLNKF